MVTLPEYLEPERVGRAEASHAPVALAIGLWAAVFLVWGVFLPWWAVAR